MKDKQVLYVIKCKRKNPAGDSLVYLAKMNLKDAKVLQKKHHYAFESDDEKTLKKIELLFGVPYFYSVYWFTDSEKSVYEKFSRTKGLKKLETLPLKIYVGDILEDKVPDGVYRHRIHKIRKK